MAVRSNQLRGSRPKTYHADSYHMEDIAVKYCIIMKRPTCSIIPIADSTVTDSRLYLQKYLIHIQVKPFRNNHCSFIDIHQQRIIYLFSIFICFCRRAFSLFPFGALD